MSCFLVDEKIIGAIAAYAVDNDLTVYGPLYGLGYESKTHVATCLALANIDSVEYRYPHHIDENSISENDIYIKNCADLAEANKFIYSPGTMAKYVDCLDYQSCEPDNWYQSNAYKILTVIRANLAKSLPDYESTPWG